MNGIFNAPRVAPRLLYFFLLWLSVKMLRRRLFSFWPLQLGLRSLGEVPPQAECEDFAGESTLQSSGGMKPNWLQRRLFILSLLWQKRNGADFQVFTHPLKVIGENKGIFCLSSLTKAKWRLREFILAIFIARIKIRMLLKLKITLFLAIFLNAISRLSSWQWISVCLIQIRFDTSLYIGC